MVPVCLLEAVECQESWFPEPQSQDPYSDSVAYKVCDPGKLLNLLCVSVSSSLKRDSDSTFLIGLS